MENFLDQNIMEYIFEKMLLRIKDEEEIKVLLQNKEKIFNSAIPLIIQGTTRMFPWKTELQENKVFEEWARMNNMRDIKLRDMFVKDANNIYTCDHATRIFQGLYDASYGHEYVSFLSSKKFQGYNIYTAILSDLFSLTVERESK